jgi:hypothetical protein
MPAPDLFSVPRRFDLITVLVATTGYALLFTGMRLLDFSAEALGVAGVLFAFVAAGQAATDGRMSPRTASTYAAVVFWCLFFVYAGVAWGQDERAPHLIVSVVLHLVLAICYGVLTGYFVGVLAAGVFLVSYHVREKLAFVARRRADAAETLQESSPWDESR